MTEEILQSILTEQQTARQSRQDMMNVLTQISVSLMGVPNTESKGLVGDFKLHVEQDKQNFAALHTRMDSFDLFKKQVMWLVGIWGTVSGTGAHFISKLLPGQ